MRYAVAVIAATLASDLRADHLGLREHLVLFLLDVVADVLREHVKRRVDWLSDQSMTSSSARSSIGTLAQPGVQAGISMLPPKI